MPNKLSVVDFDSLGIRWVEDDNGEKWFVLNDVYIFRNPYRINTSNGKKGVAKANSSTLGDLHLANKFLLKYNIKGKGVNGFKSLRVVVIKELLKILCNSAGGGKSDTSENIRNSLIDHLTKSLDKNFIDLWQALKEMDVSDLPPDRYVYVAREQVSGRYKIGISINPVERVKQLNIGNPELLELIHYYQACESGYLSEKMAHDLYEAHRLKGEWFDHAIDLTLLPEIVL